MNLEGKKVLVVGLGRTGEALAHFLLQRGSTVKISDKKNEEDLGEKVYFWKEKGVRVETGGHNLQSFLEADLIVPSPGVPLIAEIEAAREKGVKILSEIELAFQFLKGKIVGITGTNGKSTTATLTYKILKEGGLNVFLAGNIGTPLISFVDKSQATDIYVTEISSFQLEYIDKFKVPISVLLNISLDHLDWHPSFSSYYETKKKLILLQQKEDMAILNRDDPLVWTLSREGKPRIYGFSRKRKPRRGSFVKDSWIFLRDEREERLMSISEIPLPGEHNQENIMAAALVGHLLGVPPLGIRESIKSFKGLEHRLEKVSTVNGIDFVNDSKATNIDATLKAIQSFKQRIILILGGRNKGDDFRKLRKRVKERVKKVILLGEAKEKIKDALKGTVPMAVASSLKEAVSIGFSEASSGEIVLLAPACTSFDMFKDFEERGHIFKQEVLALEKNSRGEKA